MKKRLWALPLPTKGSVGPWPQLLRRLSRITTSGRYLPVIDGLRFVAIFLVIVQHLNERVVRYSPAVVQEAAEGSLVSWMASRGTVGVFLFFAISGFILGLPFARRYREGRQAPPLKAYLFRRLTRLEPPYIIWMLVFAAVLLFQVRYTPEELLPHLGASLLYSHNWWFGEYSPVNPVAWSLEVEVQFYLLAPFLAWLFFSKAPAGSRRYLLVGSILFALLAQHLLGLKGMPWKASLVGQLPHFLLGFLLVDFYLDQKLQPAQRRAWLWDVLGLLSLLAMLHTWSEELLKEVALSASLLFFFIAALKGRILSAVLSQPWIAAIGGMCYTIYLIHLPLLELLSPYTAAWVVSGTYGLQLAWQLLVTAPFLLGVSVVAFLLLEKPFMDPRWPQRLATLRIRKPLFLMTLKNKIMSQNEITTIACWLTMASLVAPIALQAQAAQVQPPHIERAYSDAEEWQLLQLQPLPVLIDAAMVNSPLLKAKAYDVENQAIEVAVLRREWLDNVGLGGALSLGNGQFFNASQASGDVSYQVATRPNLFYNVGVTLSIPLGSLVTRPARIKQAANEMEIAKLERQKMEAELRTMVIEYYNHVELQIRLLRIKSEALEFGRAASETAEEYFREGAMDIDQYTQTVSKAIRAEEEFEQAKSEALRSFMVLRELVGVNISINPDLNIPSQ